MSYRFQKIYYTILFTLFLACSPDYDFVIEPYALIPEELKMDEPTGIKLQDYIVEGEVNINIKLPQDGTYKIKIKDITGKLVSQEKLTARQGDNLLKIYVKALPVSSYTVELLTTSNMLLGEAIFAMK